MEEKQYSKETILKMDKYKNRTDILRVLLKDNDLHTISDVDKKLEKFMKGQVK
jgi:hypothetical protein